MLYALYFEELREHRWSWAAVKLPKELVAAVPEGVVRALFSEKGLPYAALLAAVAVGEGWARGPSVMGVLCTIFVADSTGSHPLLPSTTTTPSDQVPGVVVKQVCNWVQLRSAIDSLVDYEVKRMK